MAQQTSTAYSQQAPYPRIPLSSPQARRSAPSSVNMLPGARAPSPSVPQIVTTQGPTPVPSGQAPSPIQSRPVRKPVPRPSAAHLPMPQTPQSASGASMTASTPRKSRRRNPLLVLVVILASACFAVTAWFAQATFSSKTSSRTSSALKNLLQVDTGDTLTILALLSGILGFIMNLMLNETLDVWQWSLICRDNGVALSTILAISGTTSSLGTIGLLVGRDPSSGARIWAAAKLALMISIWASGLVLFLNTSLSTVYRPHFTYTTMAGIGPFDGSLLQPYLDFLRDSNPDVIDGVTVPVNRSVVPYTTLALTHDLITNPQHSISAAHAGCNDETCNSYILPGGLESARPRPPTNYTDYPIMLLESVPAVQIDFLNGADPTEVMTEDDCDLFWQNPWTIAIRFCLKPSRIKDGAFVAAFYVCENGTLGDMCIPKDEAAGPPSMATTVSLYSLTTSLVVARSNNSILSTTSPRTAPIPDYSLDLATYRSALRWILNFTAADIPAPSSPVEYFWSSPGQLASQYWSASTRHALQSLLVYPLWFFNVNNFGNVLLTANRTDLLVLPPEFITTASIASPFTRIVVNRVMFIIFVVLESLILLFAWATVIYFWARDVRLPRISGYPLVDFAFRTTDAAMGATPANTPTVASPVPSTPTSIQAHDIFATTGAAGASDATIRAAVRGRRLKFREEIDAAMKLAPRLRRLFGGKKGRQAAVAGQSSVLGTGMGTTSMTPKTA